MERGDQMNLDQIINEISKIRKRNNKNWMDILRLAFKHAPREAGFIMKDITECDQSITELTKELINETTK